VSELLINKKKQPAVLLINKKTKNKNIHPPLVLSATATTLPARAPSRPCHPTHASRHHITIPLCHSRSAAPYARRRAMAGEVLRRPLLHGEGPLTDGEGFAIVGHTQRRKHGSQGNGEEGFAVCHSSGTRQIYSPCAVYDTWQKKRRKQHEDGDGSGT